MEKYNYIEFYHEINDQHGAWVGEDGVTSITTDDNFHTTGLFTVTQNGETWTVRNDCVQLIEWAD